LHCKQDSDQDQNFYLLGHDWSRTRKNLSLNTSSALPAGLSMKSEVSALFLCEVEHLQLKMYHS